MAVPLYIRSVYSLLSSLCSIQSIVSYGKKYGYSALGLVDRNVLAGAIAFKKECEKANIKPVFGLEFTCQYENNECDMILYAKNDDGFKNLMALSSYISTSDNKVIDIDILNKHRKDNILCLLSDSMPLTFVNEEEYASELKKQNEIFGKYIVGIVDNDKGYNRQKNIKIKELLKNNNIKTIALSRTFYLDENDYESYTVLKCIRDGKLLADTNIEIEKGRHFLNKDEYASLYDDDDLINTDLLANSIDVRLDFKTSLPEYINKNNVPSKDYLISLCREGLRRRLKDNISEEYKRRLEYELKVIINMHFEDYFLIVYDFILYAKKHDILVGPGRGSAAGSLVAYCLGITDIDPIKYGLIFERFLNPERISMPDIDTDFPSEGRDEVFNYVLNRYGKEHVGHIITYGTLKAKQAIRDVGRVLGYQVREIDSISKLIPNDPKVSLRNTYETIPLFKQKIDSDIRYQRLYSLALKLEYHPRHESTHAAGIVMSKKPLTEIVPLIKVEEDFYSTQYTMEYLEEFGLIKMDFLVLRNLDIISEIVKEINKDEPFNIHTIPLDDVKTFNLISDVNLSGIFQLESEGMRNLIRQMKPRNFEEIGIAIALFRPGPMKNIPAFLENRAHPERIRYIHPSLEGILKETYGIIVYQEQIINIARIMAHFSYGKADILRKAMSKKKLDELETLSSDFINGCLSNGYDEKTAKGVYDLILEFANYGFNKSHSVAYGLVAYQLAYLKANYPLYFYKALLNGVISSQSKTYDYISECLKIGQKIKGINLNESDYEYIIEDNQIIMPFSIVKEVGMNMAKKIVNERNERGPFVDYIDGVKRLVSIGVDRGAIENLIDAGGFDVFGYSRNTMKNNLSNVILYANTHRNEISLINYDDAPLIREFNDDMMILAENEKDVLGFYYTFNPITAVKEKYAISTDTLYNLSVRRGQVEGFGLINRVKQIKTKKGEPMAFVDLLDETGSISLAIMPRLFGQYQTKLIKGKYIHFFGKVDMEGSCLVNRMDIL